MRLDGGTVDRLRKELARARQAPPTREAVLAVIAMLGQPDTAENRQAVVGLLFGMQDWLLREPLPSTGPPEVHALAETFIRFDAFDLLQEYARAARRRDAGSPSWRFYDIVARTRGQVGRLSVKRPTSSRRWPTTPSAGTTSMPPTASNASSPVCPWAGKTRRRPPSTLEDELDNVEILITEMIQSMPRDFARSVRDLVKDVGREAAVAVLTAQMRRAARAGNAGTRCCASSARRSWRRRGGRRPGGPRSWGAVGPALMRDPFTVLGVDGDADDAEIRRCYLALVRDHPPDREPERFREIRAAYEALGDVRWRPGCCAPTRPSLAG